MQYSSLKKTVIKLLKKSAVILVIGFLALCLTEIAYRYQIIDFYANEITSLNPDLKSNSTTDVLVFGDSFTAVPTGYVYQLGQQLPETSFINAAVSGTGIIETGILFPDRFEKYQPKKLLLQLYPANDLFDIEHPLNWKSMSTLRNAYYLACDHFFVLRYFNYRAAQLYHVRKEKAIHPNKNNDHEPEKYTRRIVRNLNAHPDFIANSLYLNGGTSTTFEILLEELERIVKKATKNGVEIGLLVIPHCSQVHERYTTQYRKMGAEFPSSINTTLHYPFLEKLRNHFNTASQVTIIDPLNAMRIAESQGTALYFEHDEHLSPIGQQWIAQYLQHTFFK